MSRRNGIRDSGFGIREVLIIVCLVTIGVILTLRLPPPSVSAQAPVRFSQQTFPFNYSFLPSGVTTIESVPNLGQAAHTIFMPPVAGLPGKCVLLFQGSNDNSGWVTLAAANASGQYAGTATAQGQFTFFRLNFNPSADIDCTTGISHLQVNIYYVGYQSPLPIRQQSTSFTLTSVSTPQVALAIDSAPMILEGMQCYNPNGSAAFVQVIDFPGTTTPSIGTVGPIVFEIPATSWAPVQANNLQLFNGAWLAATTTVGGSTAVSTALTCTVQLNIFGPFN